MAGPGEIARGILRGGALPLYHQLQSALRQRIESGQWPPGKRLPGERELARLFKVSRTTVRDALDALEQDGLIVRRHGEGTFVARRPVVATLARLQGFTEELAEQGLHFEVKVLGTRILPATAEVATALGLERGSEVVEVSRVVLLDGQALFADDSFLPGAVGRMVLAAEPGQTIYSALEAVGFPVASGEQTIEAAPAGRREAERLGIRVGQPILLIRRVTRLSDGTPVEFRRVAYRGDRYRYRISLVRRPVGKQGGT